LEKTDLSRRIKSALSSKNIPIEFLEESSIEDIVEELNVYHVELKFQNDELQRIREDLEAVNVEYMELFNSAPFGYVIFNEEGDVKVYNKAFAAIVGEEFDVEHEIAPIYQWIHPDSQDSFYFHIRTLLQKKKTADIIIKIGRPDKYRYVKISSNMTLNTDLNYIRSAFMDITVQINQEENIKYLSYHDQLTGLFNRHFFEEEFKRLNHPRNYPLGLIIADVNGLKLVNDAFGHQDGDELLILFAQCLKSNFRADEVLARWGGDEFVILLPNQDLKALNEIKNRLEESAKQIKFHNIGITAAFGYSIVHDEQDDYKTAFSYAEASMYKEKLFDQASKRRETIDTIIGTLHAKNPREEAHSINVQRYCLEFAKYLKLSQHQIKLLSLASLFHDIGKITIDYTILEKSISLSPDEYEEIKKHPEAGYRILNTVADFGEISDIVLHHHEYYDGKGYPKGLKSESIPYLSRIIALGDAYDAMCNDRPYRKGLTQEQILNQIKLGAGTQFDPFLSELFIQYILT
jgi:diguanylate cyclase (GGDEF)-like protein